MTKAADYIEALPAGRIIIEGHTDSVGPADYNEELSAKRAEKVRQYLIEKFEIPSARLEARGFGEMQPLGDNSAQEGRKLNRRVIIRSAN
jgi:OOP family OmpA-OmpF porin